MTRIHAACCGAALAAVLSLGGCPTTDSVLEFVPGSTGENNRLGPTASVRVLSPTTNLAIAGGTPVEVNWSAVATTAFADVRVFFDPDQDPENDNEIIADDNLAVSVTSSLLDTSALEAGTYFIGVQLFENNERSAFDYASGRLIVNQQATLFFNSPRDNFTLDRTVSVIPRFDVDWTLSDPDSTVTVRIFLDPDQTPNGNEFLLRESTSQTGDRFTFNLPTSGFEAGTYRILAVVDDDVAPVSIYAPGSIRLRARLAGAVDLRDLDAPTPPVSGAIFAGFNPRDNAGSFVASARDVDGDGFGDFMIVAQFGKPLYQFNLERTGIGEAYLIYGRATRFSGDVNLNSTGTLFRGEIYGGASEVPDPIRPSRGIASFAVLSDWDRDTVREFAFGIPFTDSLGINAMDADGWFRSGGVVVASGSSLRPDLGFPGGNVFNMSEFGTLPHAPFSEAPCPEGIIGPKAPAGVGGGGNTLYWQHRADPAQGSPNTGGTRLGCRFGSNDFNDQFGESISTYAFDALIMSTPNRDPGVSSLLLTTLGRSLPGAGSVTVYYCSVIDAFYPWTNVSAPGAGEGYPGMPGNSETDRVPHFGPYHYAMNDLRGASVSPSYFVDPDDATDPCTLEFANGLVNTTLLYGTDPGGRLGNAVSAGDVNGDGLDDILLGNPFGVNGAGECFIMLGRLRTLVAPGAELSVEELRRPLNAPGNATSRIFDGIRIVGAAGERLGQAQDRAGDFNFDGLPDVVIGSPLLNNRRGGAMVFFGSKDVINQTETELAFNDIPPRGLGVVFVGDAEGDLAGARVTGCGDVDGDGIDDILIAAPEKDVRLDTDLDGQLEIDRVKAGVVYLIYGSPTLTGSYNLGDIGTEKLSGAMFIGRNSDDQLGAGVGQQGDRSVGISAAGDVDGDGRRELLFGAVRASPRNRVAAGEAYLIYGQGD